MNCSIEAWPALISNRYLFTACLIGLKVEPGKPVRVPAVLEDMTMKEIDIVQTLNSEILADKAKSLAAIKTYLREIGEEERAKKAVNLIAIEGDPANYQLVISDFEYSNTDSIFMPDLVVERVFENKANVTLQDTFTYSKTQTETQGFSFTEGLKVGTKASAKVGLPLIGNTSVEVNAEVTFNATQNWSTTTQQTWQQSSSVTVPPHTSVKVKGFVKTAKLTSNFVGKVRVVGGSVYLLMSATTDPNLQWKEEWYLDIPLNAILAQEQLAFPVAGSFKGAIGTTLFIESDPLSASVPATSQS
jgi:hypothetical protein